MNRRSGGQPYLFFGVTLLIFLLVVWIYWPGTSGPYLLDDHGSLAALEGLIDNPQLWLDYVMGDRSGVLGRPVSILTFVLETLFLESGPASGKSINIGLHLINGCLVIGFLYLILSHEKLYGSSWLALLFGGCWLLSPLYVSTVLYVVQRMAMLSAFFVLLALVTYCLIRIAQIRSRIHSKYLLLMPLLFLLVGIFAKENAVVGLPILLLLEILVFRYRGWKTFPAGWGRVLIWTALISGVLFLGAYLLFTWDSLIASYGPRPFSMEERLMSESRIIWDYLGQLVSPDVFRMGVHHDDFPISKSLLHPVSTLYSFIAWAIVGLMLVFSYRYEYWRVLIFSVSIFLIGHSVESTIIPLELYFEHRNYLPGIGIFLFLAIVFGSILTRWPELQMPLCVLISLWLLSLALKTSSQVQIWSNKSLLYVSQSVGHPHSPRVNIDMAVLLAQVGALDEALDYSRLAHEVNEQERAADYDLRDLILSCYASKGLKKERLMKIGSTDSSRPISDVHTLNVLVRLLQDDSCPVIEGELFADKMASIFLASNSTDIASHHVFSRLAVLENSLERYENAYRYMVKYLTLRPTDPVGLLMQLHFATATGRDMVAKGLIEKLSLMQGQGVLSQGQEENLSFYIR